MREIDVTPQVLDKLRERGGARGWVPVIDIEGPQLTPTVRLTPWWNDPVVRFRDTGEIGWRPDYQPGKAYAAPASVGEAIAARTPPETRTTAQEKFEALTAMLTQEARKFTVDGVTKWPASVQKELDEAAWKMGKPGNLSLAEQVELLARTYIVTSAHKQKEQDRKDPNSIHPSRGHYAA